MTSVLILLNGFDPGTYFIEDDGTLNAIAQLRTPDGSPIQFNVPTEFLTVTASAGRSVVFNLTEWNAAADITVGSLTDATQNPDSIQVQRIPVAQDVMLASNGAISEFGADPAADIVASSLAMSAASGIGAGNAIETQTTLFEAETTTGGINISNFGSVQIGGVNADVDGLEVVTSGNINFTTVGSIFLSEANSVTASEVVRGGSVSGDVALTAVGFNSDIIGNVDNTAITASRGSINVTAGRDVQFGTIGLDFNNDVIANGAITIAAGRDVLIDGFADILSDNFGLNTGGNLTITAGRNIGILNLAGTSASVTAAGSAGADLILTTGSSGSLSVFGPGSFAAGSTSGDVIANADRIIVDADSGISAPSGRVILRPVTAGWAIDLGSATDAAFALELSDVELDRLFTPTLAIGDDNTGQITVSSALSPANATNLVLRSGGDIAIQAAITTTGDLELRAADNLVLSGAPAFTVGGTLSIFVDTLGNDGGIGGIVDLSTVTITAASVLVNGAEDNDTLTGAQGIDQVFHGNGGNDRIVSSGEGQYFGDAGDDTIVAGLSNAIVPEILDGGIGIDTLDTSLFNGNYVINLVTGATNFDYESFVNFE
ncbi:MAG: hypothetical protein F9K19_15860, partial [Rhizobiaceae bacterium]